jgi:hypothetical protein
MTRTSAPEKNEKRSPIKQRPLRRAGESLEEQFDDSVASPFVAWVMAALMALGLAVFEWIRWLFHSLPTLGTSIMLTLIAAGSIGLAAFKIKRLWKVRHALREGIKGERAVADLLESLRTIGYHVYHDIIWDDFNLDHAIIGPAGVFALETKCFGKIPGNPKIRYDGKQLIVPGHTLDRDPIAQSKAVAGQLRDYLAASTAQRPYVRPVLLFPGWLVDEYVQPNIWVLNPTRLIVHLQNEPARLSPDDIKLFTSRLELHIRGS